MPTSKKAAKRTSAPTRTDPKQPDMEAPFEQSESLSANQPTVDPPLSESSTASPEALGKGDANFPGKQPQVTSEEYTPNPTKGYSASLQTINDQAKASIEDDRLGFVPYVKGVATFLSSKQTVAPLSIAVGSPWGKGKTTFMQMIDSTLQSTEQKETRFATVWFNPWKYGDSTQVWAAFLDVVTRRIHSSIGIWSRLYFEATMLKTNFMKKLTTALVVRAILLFYISWILWQLAYSPDMYTVHESIFKHLLGVESKPGQSIPSILRTFLPTIGLCFVIYRFYFDVLKKVNFGLLDYLKLTNFEDKVGTLAYFEREMKVLNQCIPKNLKIVVFIDDLDRCKPAVLAEMIEALTLLEVSRRCIFILGMDSQIVAKKIEAQNSELNSLIEGMDVKDCAFQKSVGHRFLEKILQASISVPAYEKEDMRELIKSLTEVTETGKTLRDIENVEQYRKLSATNELYPAFSQLDSPEVKNALEKYGENYFTNPRRLKRFVNSFRLHVHLAPNTGCKASVEELARFLVLTEKWPGIVAYYRDHLSDLNKLDQTLAVTDLLGENNNQTASTSQTLGMRIFEFIREGAARELLLEPEPLSQMLLHLCEWSGFEFTPPNGENSPGR